MREALLAGEGQNAQMEPYVIPASRISKRDLPKKRGFLIGVAFCIVIMLVVTGIWMAGACSEEGRDGNSNRNECSIDRGADSNDGGCTDCHGR